MIDWNIMVLDETQAIKKLLAKGTKAVKMITRRGTAIAVAGVPIKNNLIDLWSISDFAIQDY